MCTPDLGPSDALALSGHRSVTQVCVDALCLSLSPVLGLDFWTVQTEQHGGGMHFSSFTEKT